MTTSRRTTLKHIAQELGVTITTVSCILNDTGGKYAEETRKKVLDTAKRLRYRPNALASGIRGGKTHVAGVMIQNRGHFSTEIINGIHDKLLENQTIMFLTWNSAKHTKSWDEKAEQRTIHHLIDRRVDGIILSTSNENFDNCYFEEIWERNVPLILVDRQIPSISADFIGTDNQVLGTLAARHLLDLEHKRFLFCSNSHVGNAVQREAAFAEVLASQPATTFRSIDFMAADCSDQLRDVFGPADTRPTGVLCINDWTAIEVRRVAASMGLEAPRDFSIIGSGDQHFTDPFAQNLTTFDQKPYWIGQCAAQCYLSRVHGQHKKGNPQIITIKPELLIRGSTATAPRAMPRQGWTR